MSQYKIETKTTSEVVHETEGSILIIRNHGFLKPEELEKDNGLIMDTIKSKKIRGFLSNQRDVKVLSTKMQSQMIENAKRIAGFGVKKLAVVLPVDVFALAGISKLNSDMKNINIKLDIKMFSSEEDGLKWLRSASS